MDNEAQNLANAFLKSGRDQMVETYTVTDKIGQLTDEEIKVIVIKKKREVYKSVAGP